MKTPMQPAVTERTRRLVCNTLYVVGAMLVPLLGTAARMLLAACFDDGQPPLFLQILSEVVIGCGLIPYFRWAQRFCYGDRFDAWGRERKPPFR